MNKPMIKDYDIELLTILMEECGEVIQECSKILRFGNDYSKLEKELGDLQCMISLLHEGCKISHTKLDEYELAKYQKLAKYSNLHDD